MSILSPGIVVFTGDKDRLTRFYQGLTDWTEQAHDDDVTVLGSDGYQLVIHTLVGEPPVAERPQARHDSYLKPFFPVASLAVARERATALGGQLRPEAEEWEARGFRACEAIDPDGNVIQFREQTGE